jgi:hypothetical protein
VVEGAEGEAAAVKPERIDAKFEPRLRAAHRTLRGLGLIDEPDPRKWLEWVTGCHEDTVGRWCRVERPTPGYAWFGLEVAEHQARRPKDHPEFLLRRLQAIRQQMQTLSGGFLVGLESLEDKLREAIGYDPGRKAKMEEMGDR